MLFDRRIEPSCGYCHYGAELGFGEIACIKFGIMSVNGSCAAFSYEPIRRKPHVARRPSIEKLDEKEFSLEE